MHKVGDTKTVDGLRYIYIGYGRWEIDVTNSTIVNKDGQTADVIQDNNTDIESVVQTPAAAGVTSAGATFELWYEDT